MKIIQTRIMRGPNYWSNYRKNLIALKIDLENHKNIPTNDIPHFNDELKNLMPSLITHQCSLGKEGGFFERLEHGTMLGHVLEHLALELQTLAGMDCGYGRARETPIAGIYQIVFSYQIEEAGLYAGEIAFNIINCLIQQKKYCTLKYDLKALKDIYERKRLGPSTEAMINEAHQRQIPVTPINEQIIMLGYGCKRKIISATLSNQTSCIAVDVAADKNMTKNILLEHHLPVPQGFVIESLAELEEKIAVLGFPVVIKPRYGNHGRGITTFIYTKEKAIQAFNLAKKISNLIILEKCINGNDYRILVINYKLAAVAKRVPARIIGDGIKTIRELIEDVNQSPLRGSGHQNILTLIELDEVTLMILEDNGLSPDSILPKEKEVFLKNTANISTGGTAMDMTDDIHPYNIFLAERVARLVNLDVCGIDLIAEDITLPITPQNSAILEVNAAPGFRMHLYPTIGKKRNVAKSFIEMLFPKNQSSRIPIVAVTGTNGKTTVVRLISHIVSAMGLKVGMATTEGLYLNNKLFYAGDCSGPLSAKNILCDPWVEFAVLECARGGILRSGLGFDYCSTSIVTNISEDHIGMDEIYSLKELANVKSVVPHSTLDNGYAILNADDPLVYKMKDELHCKIALFSLNRSDAIIKHCEQGHLACFIEKDCIFIMENKQCFEIISATNIPITFYGKNNAMKLNVLAAILACWVNNFEITEIASALLNFKPLPEDLPGRLNIFKLNNCEVMIDYAHNEQAYIFLKDFLNQVNAVKKIGIIAGTGDRRAKDIHNTGRYAAEIFDEIIIRHDKDSRGRTNQEITDLILEGIYEVNAKACVQIISDEFEAINYSISRAIPGTFIWYFPEKIFKAIEFIKTYV